jgi:hypothetical protein
VSFGSKSGVGPNHFRRPSKSLAHSMSNPIAARGFSLVIKPCPDPEEKLVNEQGPIVETSDHSINRRHGGSSHGDRTVSSRYHDGQFFMQGHADLSLCLTEGYTHSLTERCTDVKP